MPEQPIERVTTLASVADEKSAQVWRGAFTLSAEMKLRKTANVIRNSTLPTTRALRDALRARGSKVHYQEFAVGMIT